MYSVDEEENGLEMGDESVRDESTGGRRVRVQSNPVAVYDIEAADVRFRALVDVWCTACGCVVRCDPSCGALMSKSTH